MGGAAELAQGEESGQGHYCRVSGVRGHGLVACRVGRSVGRGCGAWRGDVGLDGGHAHALRLRLLLRRLRRLRASEVERGAHLRCRARAWGLGLGVMAMRARVWGQGLGLGGRV